VCTKSYNGNLFSHGKSGRARRLNYRPTQIAVVRPTWWISDYCMSQKRLR